MFSDKLIKDGFFKRTTALLLAAGLIVALASCGDDDKKSGKKNNSDSYGSSQSTKSVKGPNIVEFDDSDEDEEVESVDAVTTTTTTAPSRTKKTTTTETETTTRKSTTAKPTETKNTETKATTAPTQPASNLHNKYKVTSKTYTAKDGVLKYKCPQITGLYDEKMQSFYNEFFKNSCTKSMGDNSLENFSGTYEVKYKTKDTLSIVFRESFSYSGAAHGYSTAYAVTIDLATGFTVIPSESVDIDKATEAINNDTWTLTRSADGVTKKNIVDYFNQYDEMTANSIMSSDDVISVKNSGGKYTVSGKRNCASYFDVNGDPVLILEVNHALGDYVEVQIQS